MRGVNAREIKCEKINCEKNRMQVEANGKVNKKERKETRGEADARESGDGKPLRRKSTSSHSSTIPSLS